MTYEDEVNGYGRVLRVAFAAASRSASVTVAINGNDIGHFAYDNDAAVYRDALQSGNFHAEVIEIPENYLVDGPNTISFELLRGLVMYDAISFAVDE